MIELVSKGEQDVYLTSNILENSLFRSNFTQYTPYSCGVEELNVDGRTIKGSISVINVTKKGDILGGMWLEGTNITEYLSGSKFDLYIGEQLIESHTYEYMSDIWPIYLPENNSKSKIINNKVTQTDKNFCPFHFFFCDNNQYLPLISLTYQNVVIKITWGQTISTRIKCKATFNYLGNIERKVFENVQMDMMITQVQKINYNISDGTNKLSLNSLNHPVKCIFFGYETKSDDTDMDYFTFDNCDIYLNGITKYENMSPNYFYTIQSYHHSPSSSINFENLSKCPFNTRFYAFSFAKYMNKFNPTGTCNFSRLDNANLVLKNISRPPGRTTDTVYVYAINYNILRINAGISGILFSN